MASNSLALSAIVPTHGRPHMLVKSLTSIATQTLKPTEVIIVDDLGDDATRTLVEELRSSYPVPLLHVRNLAKGGACASRNLGGETARGDLLAFLDDDDIWLPTYVEKCLENLSNDEADFSVSYLNRAFTDGRLVLHTTPKGCTAENVLHSLVHMTGSNCIITKAAFNEVGGFDEEVPVFNDWDLFIRLIRSGKKYTVIEEALVHWNEHGGERITAGTVRRADGIHRFLMVYGDDMSPNIRSYFIRLEYGIRKAHVNSRYARLLLTIEMLRKTKIYGAYQLIAPRIFKNGINPRTL